MNVLIAFVLQIASWKGHGLGAGELDNGRNDYVCLNSSGDEVGVDLVLRMTKP